MKWPFLIMLAMMVFVAVYWAQTPPPRAPHGHDAGSNCAGCHEDSIPFTHTKEFMEKWHGVAAREHRANCMSCHDNEDDCQECHQSTSPEWETDAVRNPGRGPLERDEHSRIGAAHRGSCMECHESRFLPQCASCHRPDEWDQ